MANFSGDPLGNSELEGTDYSDSLFAYGDGNLLKGGDGDDLLDVSDAAGASVNTLKGGDDNDTLLVTVLSAGNAVVDGNMLVGDKGADDLIIDVQSDAGASVTGNTLDGGKDGDSPGRPRHRGPEC